MNERYELKRWLIDRSITRCVSRFVGAIGVATSAFIPFGGGVAAEQFPLPQNQQDEVVGEVRYVTVQRGESLLDIARAYDIGYNQIIAANDTVNRWVPPVGREVVVPSRYILPSVPKEGIVLNLAELRLYYFPSRKRVVYTYPVSIGDLDWQTPLGLTKVGAKEENPVWTPPASIRREHAEVGVELPPRISGGAEDNPLGRFALRLKVRGYLIHGTDAAKEFGIGMHVTHGCIRMYPDDIEQLYRMVQVGTSVRIIDEPVKAGWRGGELYLEVHRPREPEDIGDGMGPSASQVMTALKRALRPGDDFDESTVVRVFEEGDGIPHVVGRRFESAPFADDR
jgi:L,D-transpeptidase ErfK/SrfK